MFMYAITDIAAPWSKRSFKQVNKTQGKLR
jgi:hypothetical protein